MSDIKIQDSDIADELRNYFKQTTSTGVPEGVDVMTLKTLRSRRRFLAPLFGGGGALLVAGAVAVLLLVASHRGSSVVAPASSPLPTSVVQLTSTPSPMPTNSPLLLVLVHTDSSDASQLVGLDGSVRATIPSGFSGTGPHHAYLAGDDALTFYGASGTKLATDASKQGASRSQADPLVFSDDGSNWYWSVLSVSDSGADVMNDLYRGTQADNVQPIATLTTGDARAVLRPIKVVNGTLYLGSEASGGDNLYGQGAISYKLDTKGHLAKLLDDSCTLQDVGNDGSLLCTGYQSPDMSSLPVLHRPDGSAVTFHVTPSRSTYGDGKISPDGKTIVFGAPDNTGGASPQAQTIYIGDAATGAVITTDIRAWFFGGPEFLPDGRFVVTTGDGIVIVSPNGSHTTIPGTKGAKLMGVIGDPRD
jgi:hypothetical protein